MTCPRCQSMNPEGSRFCQKCGAALDAAGTPGAGSPSSTPPPRHFAPTGTVILAGAGLTALVFVVILAAGATFAFRAYSQRSPAQQGGIRPASQPPAPNTPAPVSPVAPPAQQPAAPPAPPPAASPPTQPPAAGAPAPPVASQPAQAVVAMDRYRAPTGQWSLSYPHGWHVKEASSGAVAFYQDDPDEGTAFAVIPYAVMPGEMASQAVLERLADTIRQQYPDLHVQVLGVRDLGAGAALEAKAAWTGGMRQAMRAAILMYVFPMRGSGYTGYSFLAGQAPAVAFDGLEPVFTQMTQSFSR